MKIIDKAFKSTQLVKHVLRRCAAFPETIKYNYKFQKTLTFSTEFFLLISIH